jgi:hypothetical protein
MKTRTLLAAPFFTAVMLLIPLPSSAMSVRQYESKTKQERAEVVASAIDKIVADVAKADPGLSEAIRKYFYVIPQGQPESPGLLAFGAELVAVEELAAKGKLDLEKVQIEGILLDVVKTDVVPKQKAKR